MPLLTRSTSRNAALSWPKVDTRRRNCLIDPDARCRVLGRRNATSPSRRTIHEGFNGWAARHPYVSLCYVAERPRPQSNPCLAQAEPGRGRTCWQPWGILCLRRLRCGRLAELVDVPVESEGPSGAEAFSWRAAWAGDAILWPASSGKRSRATRSGRRRTCSRSCTSPASVPASSLGETNGPGKASLSMYNLLAASPPRQLGLRRPVKRS